MRRQDINIKKLYQMRYLACLLLVILLSESVAAATYDCEVKDALEVTPQGLLHPTPKGKGPPYIGSKFTVDSESGVVVGALINNRRGRAREPILLGKADGKYHHVKIFTLIPEMGANFPFFVEIKDSEFYKDKASIPFSGYFQSEVFSGLCRKNY